MTTLRFNGPITGWHTLTKLQTVRNSKSIFHLYVSVKMYVKLIKTDVKLNLSKTNTQKCISEKYDFFYSKTKLALSTLT